MNIKKNSINTSATAKTRELNKLSDSTNPNTIPLNKLPDSALYKLCKEYGKNARKWSREFGFLLPEVYKRRLYRKYGCTSIYMFAAKLSGMSREVTDRILSLNHKLKDMPLFWNELKKYGWSKLEVIARVATIETEIFWIDKLRKTPRQVLIEYVREWISKKERIESEKNLFNLVTNEDDTDENNSLNKPQINRGPKFGYEDFGTVNCEENNKTIAAGTRKRLKFKVDSETEFEFRKYKQNLEKEKKEALTMGETLKDLLTKVKKLEAALAANNSQQLTKTSNDIATNQRNKCLPKTINLTVTNPHNKTARYISKQLKKNLIHKYKGKCAILDCNRPYFEIHHPERFSHNHSHALLYPLCKIHHRAAHSGLIKNEDKQIEEWEFDFLSYNPASSNPPSSNFSFSNSQYFTSKLPESIFKAYQLLEKEKIDARVRSYWIA